jgi:hypothetical protein
MRWQFYHGLRTVATAYASLRFSVIGWEGSKYKGRAKISRAIPTKSQQTMRLLSFASFVFVSISAANAFPHYARDETFKFPGAQPLPPPIKDTSSKLVNDAKHRFRAPGKHDQRGPCPGLNTLANHGVRSLGPCRVLIA